MLLDGKSWGEVNLTSALWAGAANAGLAVVGKGLSKLDADVGMQGLEKILFGTITNSPLMGMGMALNMVGSNQFSEYTVGELDEDMTEGMYALILGKRRYSF